MLFHDEIKAHAKLVARDIKAGSGLTHANRAMEFMDEAPDAILGVLNLLHRQANYKKPNEAMIQAYLYMFTIGLEVIRYQVERGQDWAEELVDAVREQIVLLAKGGIISTELLMLLLNGFIEAKLAPGDDLTELLGDMALETSQEHTEPNFSDIEDMFETLVEQAGGNEFEAYDALNQASRAFRNFEHER